MTQYIDKSALVAEIERRRKEIEPERNWYFDEYTNGCLDTLNEVLSLLDTLEVKEVDLGKEWKEFLKDGNVGFKEIAKHFFELGMSVSNKAQKGENI